MPLEIEVKLKVESHRPIVAVLRRLGAKHAGARRETNIFFDRADGSLLAADSALRVRMEVPLGNRKSKIENQKSPCPPAALLTFKGPPRKTGLRSRQAYDLTISPPEQLMPLLKSLGFEQTMLFEKDRDSWHFGGCKIELDTLPALGLFMEIEGPSERKVKAVQKKLHLEDLPPVRPSYAQMVAGHLREHAQARMLRFAGDAKFR
jgi:predicted adenylyl cyclase CyaB